MKCEEVLARLETGHAVDQWRARRHAGRCSACAAAVASFAGAKRLWSAAEPLSKRHELVWKAVRGQQAAPNRSSYPARLAIAGLALAATVLVVLLVSRTPSGREAWDRREMVKQIEPSPSANPALPLSPKVIDDEFAPLQEKLQALERRIDQIQSTAEKRDAKFQLTLLIQEYSMRQEKMR